MRKLKLISFAFLATFAFTACNDDETIDSTEDNYEIPATYDFENVSYEGQTQRLAMLTELTAYMKKANNGEVLDAQKMLDMYTNQNNAFSDASLNEASTKELENKTVAADQQLFKDFINEFAAATETSNGGEGSIGVAGVVTSVNDESKKYFFDEKGIEHIQLIEKGLMGSLIYFQGVSIYLGADKMNVDNESVEEGIGTEMEHNWDEAFGYFGVPTDFPTNKSGLLFWGKYTDGRDELMGSNEIIMNAFIKGRAAISNKDLETRDEQIEIIRTEWERVSASTAVYYLNSANSNFADDAVRNHTLSEAWAFIRALKYNPNKKLSNAEVDAILSDLGENFYEITQDDIAAAKAALVEAYGFEDIQNQL